VSLSTGHPKLNSDLSENVKIPKYLLDADLKNDKEVLAELLGFLGGLTSLSMDGYDYLVAKQLQNVYKKCSYYYIDPEIQEPVKLD